MEILDDDNTTSFSEDLVELGSVLFEELDDDDDTKVTYLELFDSLVDELMETQEFQAGDIPIEKVNLVDATVTFLARSIC